MNRILFVVGGFLLLALASLARADNAQLAGSYSYVPERSDSVDQAIASTVADMNFLIRPIAKSRLGKTNKPYQRLVVTQSGGNISVVRDNHAAIVTPSDGKAVPWKREDGEVMEVSTVWHGNELAQTFVAEDGKRINHYTLSADGQQLNMKVSVTSSKLKKPLVYTLVYKRN